MNKRRELEYRAKYIYWNKEAQKFNLKQEEFDELIKSLDKSKRVSDKTKKIAWLEIGDGAFRYDYQDNYEYIYLFKDYQWFIYTSNKIDDNKNTNETAEAGMHLSKGEQSGSKAVTEIKNRFKERTNTTFKLAFDTVSEEYKICVPKQFHYNILKDNINRFKRENKITKITFDSASGVDFSSQYPASACGILPDAHTLIRVEGKVAPSEEYPFAFYLETGHIAVYNEFDTHNWLNNKFSSYVFRTDNKAEFKQYPYNEETYTILMKASKEQLTDEYTYYYELRKENELAKLVMNSSIGCFHTKKYENNKYAHLAAVIIARANNKMLSVLNRLQLKDVIQICVDGVIYKGNRKLGVDDKSFGALHQEFINCKVAYGGNNVYIVEEEGKIIKAKHGCYNYYDDNKTKITEDNITSLDDINHWITVRTTYEERLKQLEMESE